MNAPALNGRDDAPSHRWAWRAWRAAPPQAQAGVRWTIRRLPRRRAVWGTLRRTSPLSDHFGYDRGTPVDRHHIEAFLATHAGDVAGRVLEVRDATYTRRFGGHRVVTTDIVDIDAANRQATITADICRPAALPAARFDCIILTQTLQFLADVDAGLANLWRGLAPGGVLLLTVPTISRIAPRADGRDRWRWTPAGLHDLLAAALPEASVEVGGAGNVLGTVAFLHGLAVEELTATELDCDDPAIPVIAWARVRRPGPVGR